MNPSVTLERRATALGHPEPSVVRRHATHRATDKRASHRATRATHRAGRRAGHRGGARGGHLISYGPDHLGAAHARNSANAGLIPTVTVLLTLFVLLVAALVAASYAVLVGFQQNWGIA